MRQAEFPTELKERENMLIEAYWGMYSDIDIK